MSTCHDVQEQLSLLVDGQRPDASRQELVRTHLESCAACRGVLQDLERLRRTAASLGPKAPPDHVWLAVAGQLRVAVDRAPAAPPRRAATRGGLGQWLSLAAALVAVTLGAYVFVDKTPAPGGGNAAPAGTVEAVAEELSLAMQHYERAITELETLAKSDADALDPAVASTLAENIQTIDQAIADSRGALTQEPGSEPARESLFEALRRKVVVLQATVTLMNEMRKGDQAGAAEAAAALGKKS
jgi:hypothetical protein